MGDVSRQGELKCPADVIAVAIDPPMRHCGVVYGNDDGSGTTALCDFQNDLVLTKRSVPDHYFWAVVELAPHEVDAVAALVELILAQHMTRPLPYSVRYHPNSFDLLGQFQAGAGFTCATFVVGVFEALKLDLIDVKTWKARPAEDEAFKLEFLSNNFYNLRQLPTISAESAQRLASEKMDFRIKPGEVCGAASAGKRPVNFESAKKAALRVAATIKKKQPSIPTAVLR
jgi:hypothetical protein